MLKTTNPTIQNGINLERIKVVYSRGYIHLLIVPFSFFGHILMGGGSRKSRHHHDQQRRNHVKYRFHGWVVEIKRDDFKSGRRMRWRNHLKVLSQLWL